MVYLCCESRSVERDFSFMVFWKPDVLQSYNNIQKQRGNMSPSDFIDTWYRVFTTQNRIIGVQFLYIRENGRAASVDYYFSSFEEYEKEKAEFGSWTFNDSSESAHLELNSGDVTVDSSLMLEKGKLACRYEFGMTTFTRISEPDSNLLGRLFSSVTENREVEKYFAG